MKRLSAFFTRKGPEPADGAFADDAPPQPDRLTFAIGDIHGCLDQMEALLIKVSEAADGRPHDLVFLGDYVDRGPASAAVLRRLLELHNGQTADARVICLAGNHDHMLLHFLADPEDGIRWLWVGGKETMDSFGIPELRITGGGGDPVAERVAAQAIALAQGLGEELITWIATRPLWWRSGNLVAVHALTDPTLPMNKQDEETLLWARPEPGLQARTDGTWVVHGHTIVDEPTNIARHLNIDTGAFGGGPLTAAQLEAGQPIRYLTA